MRFFSLSFGALSLMTLLAESVISQQFLNFPLTDASIPVWHGWLYDDASYHGAVDYKEPVGTAVIAAADGIAMVSSQPPNLDKPGKDTFGTFVLIKHPNGFSTLYAHLSATSSGIIVFSPEARYNSDFGSWTPVRKGDVIGFVGLSGVVTTAQPHLHFEVSQNHEGTYVGHINGRVDPYDLRKVALYYPPNGSRFTSCGANFLWVRCPILPREVVLQPGPDTGRDLWTTSVYSYALCSHPGPGGGQYDGGLRVGGWGDSYYSLLQFDLAGLPRHATSALLQVYCYSDNAGSPTAMYIDRITEFWWNWQVGGTGCDHERLWWADKPTAEQWGTRSFPAPIVGQWQSLDVTDLYNAWEDQVYPNFGLQLRPFGTSDNFNFFYSSRHFDDSLRPKLVIEQ